MSRIFAPLVVATLFLPQAAGAAAVASSSLSSDDITVTFSHDVTDGFGELFSTNSAAFGPDGQVTNDNNPLPGIADAPLASDNGITADSILTADASGVSFSTEADGSVSGAGDFGSSIGEVTGSFEFTNPTDGLIITIVMDLAQAFSLDTDVFGELAAGATALSLAVLSEMGTFLPTITLSNPACDPMTAVSVTDGGSFSSSCTTTATFLFPALAPGSYTLTFAASSGIDVTSEIPLPAAFGLFAAGAFGLAFARGRSRKTAAA